MNSHTPPTSRPTPRSASTSNSISISNCHSERNEDRCPSARFLREESALSVSDYKGGSVGSSSGGSVVAGAVAFGSAFAGAALGFAQPEQAFAGVACCAPGFPMVKYLRIFSRRFGPRPRIASKSSTLLNAPYDLRICKILSAVAGPIPGTNCNCSEFAVLMLTGCAGGFFFPANSAGEKSTAIMRTGRKNRAKRRRCIITGV